MSSSTPSPYTAEQKAALSRPTPAHTRGAIARALWLQMRTVLNRGPTPDEVKALKARWERDGAARAAARREADKA